MNIKFFFTIFTFFCLLFINNLFATVGVSDTYILLESNTRNASFTVFNRSDEPHDYKITFVHFTQDKQGGYKPLDKETDIVKFADTFLIYTPKQFHLEAGGSQVIRMQKKSMVTALDGEYVSHILIAEQPPVVDNSEVAKKSDKMEFVINQVFATSFPIVLRKGNLTLDVNSTDVIFKKEKNNMTAQFTINIKGNKSLRADVFIKDGDKIISLMKGANIFLSSKTRDVVLNFAEGNDNMNKFIKNYSGKTLSFEILDSLTNTSLLKKNITVKL
jgi:hypothetical protein